MEKFSIKNLVKTSGPLGSNPGGVYENTQSKDKFYIKKYKNPEQAKAEQASSELYNLMGVKTLDPFYHKESGDHHIVSRWNNSLKGISLQHSENPIELAKHIHAAVLTKNWDAVGLAHDNIMKHKNGDLYSVDLGGTLHFRAQGGSKDFDSSIHEYETLRHPLYNPVSEKFFERVKEEHLKKTAKILNPLTDDAIHGIISKFGFVGQNSLIQNLKSKRDKMISKYSET